MCPVSSIPEPGDPGGSGFFWSFIFVFFFSVRNSGKRFMAARRETFHAEGQSGVVIKGTEEAVLC